MRIAIHQPNYLPWLGYFNKISKCDIFVFLDNVQYSKNSYINRTQVISNIGKMWMTQPVAIKGHFGALIKDVRFAKENWKEKHKKTIIQCYCKHPFFKDLSSLLQLFDEFDSPFISEINISLIRKICQILDIKRETRISSELNIFGNEDPTERIVSIVKCLGGNVYLSGVGGLKYHNENLFKRNGISVEYLEWKNRPYVQYHQDNFLEGLSVIDAIANIGSKGVLDLIYAK